MAGAKSLQRDVGPGPAAVRGLDADPGRVTPAGWSGLPVGIGVRIEPDGAH